MMPPRSIRPKTDSNVSEDTELSGETRSGKRKTVSSACIPCRKRKSKCDGQLPACSTCIAVYRTECNYDADIEIRRKPPSKRDVQSPTRQGDALDVIVASLRALPETDAIALLQRLRNDHNNDVSLANALRANVRPATLSFASQSFDADITQQMTPTLSTTSERPPFLASSSRTNSTDDGHPISTGGPAPMTSNGSLGHWLRNPPDPELVDHLLNLYFSWIHPFHPFVSRVHFMSDLERGGTDFCSSLLLNAMLAFACHYSDRPVARLDPNDPSTAGDQFYAEALRILLLVADTASCVTTIQALGILSLRETSAGRDSNGYRYAGRSVRMALEMGLHLSVMKNGMRPPEHEMRKNLFWAVFNLETLCALAFGRLSQLPRSATDIELPVANASNDGELWRPYEDTNLSISPSAEQPAHFSLFQEYASKLFELAGEMVNTFYAPHERFTSRSLAASYGQYQAWHNDLPEALSLKNTSLPHVLVLHMYYYGCILHLFRPYIKLDLSGASLYPRDTCTFCANEISTLMNALRAMYGLRRVSLAVITVLLSASTIHLLNLPSEPAATHLTQALRDFEAISVNHRFAARSIEIIRSLSAKWHITLPENAASVAVYRSLGRFDVSSPPSSAFFAASISRHTSGDSNYSEDSPFPPPHGVNMPPTAPPSNHAQQEVFSRLDSTTIITSTTGDDSAQAMSAFWTPFPAQGMPISNPGYGVFDSLDQQPLQHSITAQQWLSLYAQPGRKGTTVTAASALATPPPQDFFVRQDTAPPGRMDESMGGMSDWNWQ